MLVYFSHINSFLTKKNLSFYLDKFPRSYQDKILRYRQEKDTKASLMGRLLLNQGLKHFGIEWDYQIYVGKCGKPFISNDKISFNISHSEELVVCALKYGTSIGIDIEMKKSIDLRNFKAYMAPEEWANIINANQPLECFYNYWTKKEAVLKANGCGLVDTLHRLNVVKDVVQWDSKKYVVKALDIHPDYLAHISFELTSNEIHSDSEQPLIKYFSSI